MPRRGAGIYERFEKHYRKTFGLAAEKYLSEFDGKDLDRQYYAIRSLLHYIDKTYLINVDNDALSQYKEDRLAGKGAFKEPAMAGTVNKELTLVTTILNKAARVWRWIPEAPLIQHVKGPTRRAYPFTWEEQEKLLFCLPKNWADGLALFALNTGVRKAELLGLKWKDREWVSDDNYVFILRDTKNGHDRAVICNSLAKKAVASQEGKHKTWVFPSTHRNSTNGKINNLSKRWLKAWYDAGLPSDPLIRKGIHNTRHTFGHRLRSAGVPDEDRNALLGHNNASLSEHYALPNIERLTELSELVTERKDTVILRGL